MIDWKFFLFGIFVGVIIMFLFSYITNKYYIRWENYLPKSTYKELLSELGPPTFLETGIGGYAIWVKPKGTIFEKIEIKDESIYHEKPKPHCDYLYATVKFPISRNLWSQIQYLTDSISYDNLKQEITARCHFMGANLATLYLAIQIAQGHKTLHEIQSSNSYALTINDAMKSEKTQKYLYDYIKTSIEQNPVYLINDNHKIC